MENMGIFKIAIVFALATMVCGRPSSSVDHQKDEVKGYRQESAILREVRPCLSRFYEVKADIIEYDEIHSDPPYVPECDKEGKMWRPSQCDHQDEGACFCVHEKTGQIVQGTKKERTLNKEALKCGMRMSNNDHSGNQCPHMQDEFSRLQVDFGLKGHSPLFYYPECTSNGKFMAMQRNERSMFFCVDTDTGDVIPETETKAGSNPPLTEDICQAYDQVWKQFKEWNATNSEENNVEGTIDESSCTGDLTFTECGCPVPCTERSSIEQFQEQCVCKPACVCPVGMFVLDGKCVDLEQCHEQKPQSDVPHSEKLDSLTAGDFGKWKEFMRNNPNAVLEKYNSLAYLLDNRALYAAGQPSFDFNNFNPFIVRPPSEGEVGFLGGESIDSEQNTMIRRVLSEGGNGEGEEYENTESEEEEYTGPSEETEILERDPYFQLQPLGYVEPEQESEIIPEEEENEGYYPEEESNADNYPYETSSEYPQFEESTENVETNEEPYPVIEQVEEPVEQEETYEPENEEYVEPEWNEQEERTENTENVQETEEPENEIDNRIVKEEMIGHQTEFSSVPTEETESEELEENHAPCDESPEEINAPLEPSENVSSDEEDLDEVNRVLEQHGIISAVEATFEKSPTSLKKTAGR